MKRSALARKTPMNRGTSTLARTVFKKKAPKKRPGHDKMVRDMCRGQPCYLKMGLCPLGETVPCHSNELALGKGMGLKTNDLYTVPGCGRCHAELDQGMRFTKEEKKAMWRAAYAAWGPTREKLFGVPYEPLPDSQ